MSNKTYLLVSGAIFLVIAILHAVRIAYGWQAMIGELEIRVWASWFALIVAGYLFWSARKLMK